MGTLLWYPLVDLNISLGIDQGELRLRNHMIPLVSCLSVMIYSVCYFANVVMVEAKICDDIDMSCRHA